MEPHRKLERAGITSVLKGAPQGPPAATHADSAGPQSVALSGRAPHVVTASHVAEAEAVGASASTRSTATLSLEGGIRI